MKMMRSLMFIMLSILVSFMVLSSIAAEGPRVFKVGDEFGWRVPLQNDTAIYSHWASSNRFHIGDSLSFVYNNDSVMEVDKWGFYHCNSSDPIIEFTNGNSTMNLERPGLFYYISGSNGHCTSGQRLIVEVMHVHHHHDQQHDIASISPSMSPISASPSASTTSTSSHSSASSLLASLLPSLFAAPLVLSLIFCYQK